MSNLIDLTGKTFGYWTVIEYIGNSKWICKCKCGNEQVVGGAFLRKGESKSCGCFRSEYAKNRFSTHNLSKTRLYNIWSGIKKRCYNKNNPKYKNYGLLGVSVCKEWLDHFDMFYNWAINNGYDDTLTIERIDVSGNYEPKNCKWLTKKEQSYNKRNTISICYNGTQIPLAKLCKELNLNYNTIKCRIFDYNYSVKDAIEKPIRKRKIC